MDGYEREVEIGEVIRRAEKEGAQARSADSRCDFRRGWAA